MSNAQLDPRSAAEWLDQGLAALALRDWEAARAAFETSCQLAPDQPDGYLNLGSLAQVEQDHVSAVAYHTMALQRDAQQVQARYCRGLSLAAQQQWASAHADFDQVIAAQPTWAEAYLNRGYVARAMGDRENAQHDWTHFLHLPEGDVALQAQVRIWLAELESEVTAATHTVGERLQLARQAYLAGDGATALRHYDAVVETDPTHREGLLARAHLYAVLAQPQAAQRDLARLRQAYPTDGELWYHQAVMQRRWGEVEAARVSLSQAESLAPDLPEIAMEWGNLLASSDPAAALRAYSQAIVRDPQALEARLARAQLYQQQGQALLAVADYRAALAQDSTLLAAHEGIEVILGQFGARIAAANQEIRPYIARANLYQQLGRLEEALSDWSEAIRLDPRNALLMAGRAQVLAEQQQYAAAYDEYTRAMDAMPQQAGFYFERAQVLVAQVRMLPALADLDRAIALAPEKGGYYLLRGMLYRQLEEVAPALADLDQAVNLTPDRGDVWQERARLYVMMQRLPEALRDYQRAVSLMPDADLHRDCAAVADVLGQSALALDHLNQALRLDPDQLDTLLERAELLIAQGAWERAIQDLDRVLIQEPNLVRPWLLRARAGVHLKRWESAASDASRALVRDAMQGEAYYLRGVSYFEMGAYAQSAQDLRHYLQRQETSGNHEQVLRLIRLADSHQQPRRKPWWRR